MDASERKYGRNDVEYATWYSDWSKQLARTHTRAELEAMLGGAAAAGHAAGRAHLKAIERTTSMQSCSQARAQTGNVARATGDTRIAISGALEIHDLFPEHTMPAARQRELAVLSLDEALSIARQTSRRSIRLHPLKRELVVGALPPELAASFSSAPVKNGRVTVDVAIAQQARAALV